MGSFSTKVTLRNAVDETMASKGLIDAKEIRQVTISAIVDTGAFTVKSRV